MFIHDLGMRHTVNQNGGGKECLTHHNVIVVAPEVAVVGNLSIVGLRRRKEKTICNTQLHHFIPTKAM